MWVGFTRAVLSLPAKGSEIVPVTMGVDFGGLGEGEALSEEMKGSLVCFQTFEWRERHLNCALCLGWGCGNIYVLQVLLAQ